MAETPARTWPRPKEEPDFAFQCASTPPFGLAREMPRTMDAFQQDPAGRGAPAHAGFQPFESFRPGSFPTAGGEMEARGLNSRCPRRGRSLQPMENRGHSRRKGEYYREYYRECCREYRREYCRETCRGECRGEMALPERMERNENMGNGKERCGGAGASPPHPKFRARWKACDQLNAWGISSPAPPDHFLEKMDENFQ